MSCEMAAIDRRKAFDDKRSRVKRAPKCEGQARQSYIGLSVDAPLRGLLQSPVEFPDTLASFILTMTFR